MKFSNCSVKQRKKISIFAHVFKLWSILPQDYVEVKNIHGQKKLARAIKKKDLNTAQRSAYCLKVKGHREMCPLFFYKKLLLLLAVADRSLSKAGTWFSRVQPFLHPYKKNVLFMDLSFLGKFRISRYHFDKFWKLIKYAFD